MLEQIEALLKAIDPMVFYGAANKDLPLWNYTVFKRNALRPTTDKRGYARTYTVGIVREDYIPEGLDMQYINAMLSIPGMRLVDGEHQHEYTVRPSTNAVVEVLTLTFVRPEKKVCE